MAGWHHWLDGRESQWTPGVGDGQGGLACCNSWGRKELDTTERLIWSDWVLIMCQGLGWVLYTHYLLESPEQSWDEWTGGVFVFVFLWLGQLNLIVNKSKSWNSKPASKSYVGILWAPRIALPVKPKCKRASRGKMAAAAYLAKIRF